MSSQPSESVITSDADQASNGEGNASEGERKDVGQALGATLEHSVPRVEQSDDRAEIAHADEIRLGKRKRSSDSLESPPPGSGGERGEIHYNEDKEAQTGKQPVFKKKRLVSHSSSSDTGMSSAKPTELEPKFPLLAEPTQSSFDIASPPVPQNAPYEDEVQSESTDGQPAGSREEEEETRLPSLWP